MKQLLSLCIAGLLFSACNSNADKAASAELARQKTLDSVNAIAAKQKAIDSMKLVKEKNEKVVTHVVEKNTMTTANAQPAKKKGWSHTAKGAVVGAGTGAITGAIINKNHAAGAAIGAAIGAGVGAGTGLIVDKSKEKKQKKAAAASNQ